MPVDFQQIFSKIKEIGQGARERSKRLEALRDKARLILNTQAPFIDELQQIVAASVEIDPNIRCAVPVNQPLDARIPAPEINTEATLLAADGSQINPDRHTEVQYCLVNVGAIALRTNSGQPPNIFTDSELLYGEELQTAFGPMTESIVALKRDLRERTKLEELSRQVDGPVITLTEGPLELWGAKDGQEARAYADALKAYLKVLSQLQSRNVIAAGYVDKPAANLMVRLLELSLAQREQPGNLRDYHPLRGVSDRWLFGEHANPLLGPGERSAVFAIQSKTAAEYPGGLSLHFFYLNVGTDRHPWPVRVEIPRWVAEDPPKLNLLHAMLIAQCRIMSNKPFPYILHRAHEIALVKHAEKYQIEQLLSNELRRQNVDIDSPSNKQIAKDHQGRTRYKK